MPAFKPLAERLDAMTDKSGECWLFLGAQKQNGYGVIGASRESRVLLAHRAAYEVTHGAIPEGLHIDHLCGTRLCVRPSHLEAVTQAENNRRAALVRWDQYTHCIHGHEFTDDNTARDSKGYRRCRMCSTVRSRQQRAARRERDRMYLSLLAEAREKAVSA
jgi:hypothetical protein